MSEYQKKLLLKGLEIELIDVVGEEYVSSNGNNVFVSDENGHSLGVGIELHQMGLDVAMFVAKWTDDGWEKVYTGEVVNPCQFI